MPTLFAGFRLALLEDYDDLYHGFDEPEVVGRISAVRFRRIKTQLNIRWVIQDI
jgi:hypothetical protein